MIYRKHFTQASAPTHQRAIMAKTAVDAGGLGD
jgi:hypothetical protein